MKKLNAKIKFIATFLAFAVMCIPTMNVQAAEDTDETAKTYTVTFRPGNVGAFALADAEGDKQANAEAVAAQVYGGYSYEVTKNGAIKVTVPAGSQMPQAPAYIAAETGYFAKETSIWGPTTQTVDKNVDFVVDYGKLVNGVEYTVEYVDSVSGESIAPVYIAQANIGETRTETAPRQIVISEGTVYNLTSAETVEKVLDADASQNVFTFEYTMAPRGTVEEEVVNYVDGGTITTVEIIDNGTTTTPAQGGGAAAGAEGEGGGAGAEAENEGENEAGNVTIEDEETPLAPSVPEEENAGGNAVIIGDEEVPLVSFPEEQGANTAVVWASIASVAAAGLAAVWFVLRKRRTAEETTEEK